MSKQDNIYNLRVKHNSGLHISNFIEPIIKPFTKKYGVKVDELSIVWKQVFEDEYENLVYPKKIATGYRYTDGKKIIYRRLHLEVSECSVMEIEYKRNLILDKVNEIYGDDFISDLVIKRQNFTKKQSLKYSNSSSSRSEMTQAANEIQATKSQTLEDALIKLGNNIKEQRKNEKE